MDVDHSTDHNNIVPFNPQVNPKSDDLRISPVEFKSSFENKNTIKIPVHKMLELPVGMVWLIS